MAEPALPRPTLEGLFERYRREGDLEALGAVFDRTAPQLLALAAHLVRDPVEAEDLVQATFLAAIEGARSFDSSRRLEPWLAGILARTAARHHRERRRSPDPDRLAPRSAGDPAARAEQAELAAELARGIAGLPEPYRGVLEQHLVHGERALDIARASGRAPGTVRMQILRGLERLRRALPAGLFGLFPLGRAPRGLGALRRTVLSRAELAAGATAASALAGPTLIGGLVVSSKAIVAVVLTAALALAVLWKLERGPARPVEVASTAPAAAERALPLEIEAEPGPLEPASPIAPEAEPGSDLARREIVRAPGKQAAEPSLATGLWLAGELHGLDGLRPEEASITATTFRGPSSKTSARADGTYALDVTALVLTSKEPPSAVYVSASHHGFATTAWATRRPGDSSVQGGATYPAQRKASEMLPIPDSLRLAAARERTELRLDLDLAPRTAIVGRVELAEGVHPYALKVALAATGAEGPTEVLEDSDCDEDGRFALYPAAGGDYLLVARNQSVPPASLRVHAPDQVVTDAGTLRLAPGGVAIEGVLLLPFGGDVSLFALRAARVAGEEPSSGEADWEGLRIRREAIDVEEQSAKVRVDGAFRIGGLAPGTYDVFLESDQAPEMVVPSPALRVEAPAAGVLLGEHLGRVEVIVTGAEERGVAELQIPVEQGRISRHVSCGEPQGVIADRRAPLAIEALAPGFAPARQEWPALARGVQERIALELRPDEQRATFAVEWTLPTGAPPPAWVTASLRGSGEREHKAQAQPEQGECVFRDLEPGLYRVALEPRGPSFWEPLASFLVTEPFEIELEAGETARRAVAWQKGGGARFVPEVGPRPPEVLDASARVLDASGRELAVRFVTREFEDGGFRFGARTGSVPIRGPSELEPRLPPGSYELVIEQEGREPVRVPFAIAAGELVDVPFTLE